MNRGYGYDSQWSSVGEFDARRWPGTHEIIETYLTHFFKAGKKPNDFISHLESDFLTNLQAKVKLYMGEVVKGVFNPY